MSAGKNGKLYINTGTSAAPVLVLIAEARDVDFPMAADKIDESDRSSDFKKYDAGMIDLSISFKMTYRNGNTNCTTIRNAILAGSTLEFIALDGTSATVGAAGPRFFGKVFANNGGQPLTDGQTYDVEVAPTYFEEAAVVIDPSFYVVPA